MIGTRALNILIVDDNAVNRIGMKAAIKRIMKNIPINIVFAEDGDIAVDKCKQQAFDLIFMDYNMPHLNGELATKKIREGDLNKKGQCVIFTCSATACGELSYIGKEGQKYFPDADAQLNKPLEDNQLVSALTHYGHLKENFIKIPFKENKDPALKMNNPVLELAYLAEIKSSGSLNSFNTYHLVYTDGGINFVSNTNKPELIPENGSYPYVVIQNEKNKFILKIANGGHYYIADKAQYVYAAGDIQFRDNKIISIDNRSGSYHLTKEDLLRMNISADELKDSLISVLKEVNLPTDKFVLFVKQENVITPITAPISSNVFSFFTPSKVAVFALGGLILAGGLIMQNA